MTTISPIAFAIASMALQSLADCVYKRGQVNGIVPETFLVFQSYTFGLTALATTLVQGTFPAEPTAWKYGPVCGGLAFCAFYFFLKSLRLGQVSVNTMIFRMSFVLTALLAAAFLDESLTFPKIIGLLAAFTSVLCLTVLPNLIRKPTADAADILSRKIFLRLPLLAFLCLGLLSFIYKLAALEKIPSSGLIFIQFTFFSPLAMIYAAFRRKFYHHLPSIKHGLTAGVLLSSASILLVSALERGEAGIMVPINQMSFGLTALLAVFWFKEKWSLPKTLGMLLATGAVYLLSSVGL